MAAYAPGVEIVALTIPTGLTESNVIGIVVSGIFSLILSKTSRVFFLSSDNLISFLSLSIDSHNFSAN